MERKEACLYLLNLVSVINLELALSLADSLQLLSPCRGMILKPKGDQLQLYPLRSRPHCTKIYVPSHEVNQ
jgi:hypothetical protein